jgi:cystathionine gamma-synthase
MRFESLVIHGYKEVALGEKDVSPAIHLSTTFEREKDGSYPEGYSYTRRENPNRTTLEQTLALIEGGAEAAAFGSGSAATSAVFMALKAGDHVVAPNDAYYGTGMILRELFGRWGLTASFVDMSDLAAVKSAITPKTRLLWVETPSNPLMKVTDLKAVADLAHAAHALAVADNTVASPALQSPFQFGFDLVLHSTTKYISGHSDVLGGAVIARETGNDAFSRIRSIQHYGGGVPSPFDCWLALRGLKTMALRVERQSRNALAVATFLSKHKSVESVYYAGLPAHPGHELAARQMKHFGGLLSFCVKGGQDAAYAVAAEVGMITRATSLGGVESLIEHRASMEGPGTRTPANLLRLSVGIENADDIIADLDQALSHGKSSIAN